MLSALKFWMKMKATIRGKFAKQMALLDRRDFKQTSQKTVRIVLRLSETFFSVPNYTGRYIILGTKPGPFSSVENSVADWRAELLLL